MIDITGLNKADVLRVLYNRARTQGLGILHYTPEDMTVEEAQDILDHTGDKYFDYLKGRVMKVDLNGDSFNPRLYDRDNGEGAAESAIGPLRAKHEAESLLP